MLEYESSIGGIGCTGAKTILRMSPMFETSTHECDWIKRISAVGTGDLLPDGPVYSIFEVF